MSARKWETTLDVTLPCYEDQPGGEDVIYAPPGKVLRVSVVDDRAFLDLCDYDEAGKSYTSKVKASAHVDANALLSALVAQMDVEHVRHIFVSAINPPEAPR